MVFSRKVCVKYDEVEGKRSSVIVEDVGLDRVFVEGEMMMNKYWLGL